MTRGELRGAAAYVRIVPSGPACRMDPSNEMSKMLYGSVASSIALVKNSSRSGYSTVAVAPDWS